MLRRLLNPKLGMIADQGVSSISNLGLTVLVAADTDVPAFARFTLVYAAYSFLCGAQRAFVGEPLILRVASDGSGARQIRQSVGVCVIAEMVVAAGFVLAWSITGSSEVLWAAAAVPIALFQDSLRFCGIARERYGSILSSDVIWLLVIGVGAIFRSRFASGTASPWLVLWGIGAAAGAVVLLKGDRPVFSGCIAWLRAEAKLSGAFLVDHLAASGLAQTMLFLLPAVTSLSVVAAVKVGQTAGASVLAVLQLAVSYSTLPAMTRAFNVDDYRPAMRIALKSIAAIALLGLAWAALLLVVPDSLGATFFGPSWSTGGALAPILALQATAASFWLQGVYLMRVSGNAGRSVVLRVIVSPVILAVVIGLAKFYGGEGAAWGSVGSTAFAGALWWWMLWSLARTARRAPATVGRHRARPLPASPSPDDRGRGLERRRPRPYGDRRNGVSDHSGSPTGRRLSTVDTKEEPVTNQ